MIWYILTSICLIYPYLFLTEAVVYLPRAEAANALSAGLAFWMLISLLKDRNDLSLFLQWLLRGILISGTLTTLLGFVKFDIYLRVYELLFLTTPGETYAIGTSLIADYNLYAMGGLVTCLAAYFLFRRENRKLLRAVYIILLALNGINVFLAGSRMGLIWLVLFSVVLTLLVIRRYIIMRLSKLSRSLIVGLALFAALIAGLNFFWYYGLDKGVKRKVVSAMGYDPGTFCINYAGFSHRYGTILYPLSSPKPVNDRLLYPEEIKSLGTPKSISVSTYASRIDRWRYGFQLFNRASFKEQWWGGGFDYLKDFVFQFQYVAVDEEYPKNPVVSSLLYAGLFGTLILLIFIGRGISLYWKHRNQARPFIIIYLVVMCFLMTNFNSVFSDKFSILFLILPFLFDNFADPVYQPEE
ncbi:MAG: O-antigen ligase family protein [Bacteroidetes bacterium]|nr:O-antigen ligase family protein [Bacteroidota bacterium]